MMTTEKIAKIRQVVRFFETSRKVGADYAAIATFNDGPNKRRQVTFGASQTTEYGQLKTLLTMYALANGKYSTDFKPYMKDLGNLNRPSLATNPDFIALLKLSANDKVMQETQDRFFNIYYFNPARQWCERNGLILPLSMLVIYDSFVHSGSIMDFLRNKFNESVPSKGGDEKRWITAYVNSRDEWLENNTRLPILQKTDYRTDSFIFAIRSENWQLDKPFVVVDYKQKDESDKAEIRAEIN